MAKKRAEPFDPVYQFVDEDGKTVSIPLSIVQKVAKALGPNAEDKAPKLKVEWWELWHLPPGGKPLLVRPYGESVPHWIPDYAHCTKKSAFDEKRRRGNHAHDKVIHVRRYTSIDSVTPNVPARLSFRRIKTAAKAAGVVKCWCGWIHLTHCPKGHTDASGKKEV